MDSPHQIVSSSSTSTSPNHLQDSPFFSYLCNLSPIMPAKAVDAAQGSPELTYPPLFPMFPTPHVNFQQEASYVKRSKFYCLSNSEFSLAHNNRGAPFTAPLHFPGPSAIQSMTGSIPWTHTKDDSYHSVQVQPYCALGQADQFMDNALDLEDYSDSCSREAKCVPQALQSDWINSKGHFTTGRKEVLCSKMAAQVASVQESEVGALGNPLWLSKSVENEGVKDGEWPSNEGSGGSSQQVDLFQSDMPLKPASDILQSRNLASRIAADSLFIMSHKEEHRDFDFGKYQSTCSKTLRHRGSEDARNAGNIQQHGLHFYTPALPKPFQFVGRERHDESSGAVSEESVQNKIPYAFEDVNHNQHSMPRRCLQFETVDYCYAAGHTISNSSSPLNPTGLEAFESPKLESLAAPCNSQRANFSQPTAFRSSSFPISRAEIDVDKVGISIRDSGNSPMESPIPAGIGLHLNGNANLPEMSCTVAENMQLEMDWSSAFKETSLHTVKPHLPASTTVSGKISTNISDVQQESQSIGMGSLTLQPTDSTKHLENSLQSNLIEHHMSPGDKRMPSVKVDSFEKLSQGPKRKRMKKSRINDDSGGKRCNCKKSKCLKLYCECFSTGLYCAESCACLECYNKVEYEDTVLETRKQIESRNPLAFAPKLVYHVMESPSDVMDSINQVTPSSVWHKKGCNCKKSQCQKKYCECYQAGVGCSGGCRCEGCKNAFGIKDGFNEVPETVYRSSDSERWKDPSDDKEDITKNRSDVICSKQYRRYNLPQTTQSFQFSNHEKEVLGILLPSGDNHCNREIGGDESLAVVPCTQESECTTAGTVDQFLKQNGLADTCDTNSQSHHVTGVSESSSSSSSRSSTEVSCSQVLRKCACVSLLSSICDHGFHVAPLPQIAESKLSRNTDSYGRLYNILEDDTPKILREPPTTITAIKAISPNQKRVSSPRIYLDENSEKFPLGLRNARRFAMQSIFSWESSDKT